MADLVDHAARLRRVLDVDRVSDAAQAERAQRVELALVRAVLGLELRHLHAGSVPSAAGASPSAATARTASSSTPDSASVPAMISAATSSPAPPPMPSTLLIDRPRSSATSSGRRRPCRP